MVAAEFGDDCGSRVVDSLFFDGAINAHGAPGSAHALGLPSGHVGQIISGSSTRIERQVSDYFDDHGRPDGRPTERRTVQDLSTPSPVIYAGELHWVDYIRRSIHATTGGATPTAIWAENYRYDGFGNLLRWAQLHDGGGTGQFRQYEHYQYDLLHRMTLSSLTTTGATGGTTTAAVDFGYDIVGNLRKKTDYSINGDGAYVYPLTGQPRPNTVQAVYLAGGGVRNYRYDATGNVVCSYLSQGLNTCNSGYGLRAHHNHNHQPTHQQRLTWGANNEITSNNIVSFTYGADQQPARQWGTEQLPSCANLQGGCLPHHRIYLDRYEDTVGAFRPFDTGTRQYRTRAYVGDYLVATRGRYGELELSFLQRDRLGSVVGVESVRLRNRSITEIVPETRHGFDAYGAPRNNRRWNGSAWETADNWSSPTRTQQGFTGHERLSGLQLIHMKGRVFDPILGRFHGVDPIIQFPLSSQGLNPYSYILNNPMAGVDPTGYCVAQTGTRIKDCVKVTQKMSDGSSRTSSYNTRSAGDMARAAATPISGMRENGASQRSLTAAPRDDQSNSADLNSVSARENDLISRVPREVKQACGGYQSPVGSSCLVDEGINAAATTSRASGAKQLDPAFSNEDVQSGTTTQDGVVTTVFTYQGSVDDGVVAEAARRWTGNGKDINISLVRQGVGLRIEMRSTPEIARIMGLCTCEYAYWVGGRTDVVNQLIIINQDRARSENITSLAHELGHLFFGEGHPKVRGDLGLGGIMDYSSRRVNREDRQRFRAIYGGGEE